MFSVQNREGFLFTMHCRELASLQIMPTPDEWFIVPVSSSYCARIATRSQRRDVEETT